MQRSADILRIISARKAAGERFALATVVRTVAATAAKAGAKAVILPDGTISEGWIGGGCARAAVLKAAKDALTDGKSRLVSVQPPDLLDEQGHASGEEQGGVRFAKNMCPNEGTMDIFVEPVLPRSQIIICGSSPVAIAIADFAKRAGFAVTACAPTDEQAAFGDIDRRIEGYALPVDEPGARYIVISTQGRGDEAALLAALAVDAQYVALFPKNASRGSRRLRDSILARLLLKKLPSQFWQRLLLCSATRTIALSQPSPDPVKRCCRLKKWRQSLADDRGP
jgi:xanthine dehydrogenase accessory factor